ncbi:MAG: CotH kinase family protein [Crocinitomicaceae bacterium]|nr:CotH kinase family protein [Crocinitomicaceae bacterium]
MRLLVISLVSFSASIAFSQCSYNNTFIQTVTPTCPGSITVSCMNSGEYFNMDVVQGNIYTVTTCGSSPFDSQLTVYDNTGTTSLAYNDDACGLQSTVSFIPAITGSVHVLLDRYNCENAGGSCMDVIIGCDEPVVLDSSNLPIVIINTVGGATIPNDPKIDATMGIIYNGPGVINYMTDPHNEFSGDIGIELRGSSSQSFPKKQWGVETRTNLGQTNDVSIFGMAFDNDWVLQAPYSDKSLIRNVLAYDMGWDLEEYSPRTQLCEVVLNGQYEGVYVFMEKIKRKDGKVGTNDIEQEDISGNELTGDYVLKVDKTTSGGIIAWSSAIPPYVGASEVIGFQCHDPSIDSLNATQLNYIETYITDFENALNGPNFSDPILGYAPYIDMISFIDFFLVNEVSKNVDGYRISSFLNKIRASEGGKLYAGPLWDFNLAFGNANYCDGGNTSGWEIDFYNQCSGGLQNPFWWEKLTQDPNYTHDLNCRWTEMRQGAWHSDSLMARIDNYASYIDNAQQRNFNRWQIHGTYIWPNNFVGNNFQEDIAYMKDWIIARVGWMDANMFGSCPDLGVEEKEINLVQVFPNPAVEDFNFSFKESISNGSMELMNLSGQIIYRANAIVGKGIKIHIDDLSSGMYYYTFNLDGKISKGKLMIQ